MCKGWNRRLGLLLANLALAPVLGRGLGLAPFNDSPTATPPPAPTPTAGGVSTTVLVILVGLIGLAGLVTIALIRWRSRGPAPTLPDAPYLQSLGTTGGPREFRLSQPATLVGRAEHAGIRIDESFYSWETVSREHAWIRRQGDQVIVVDNNSLNGVHVNGRRTGRNLLQDGWRLEIGAVAFVFHAASDQVAQHQGERGVGRSAR